MPSQKYFRLVVLTLALAGLLIISGTLGSVWHSHSDGSERACPVCHFSHQTAAQPLVSHRLPVLAPVGHSNETVLPRFVPSPELRKVPARAPPVA